MRRCAFAWFLALLLVPLRAATDRPDGQASPAAPRPSRIVCLIPAVTEMLFAMGAGDAVIGVSSYDHYPAAVETRTRVGALIDPDFERILSLRPDLVIVYGTQNDLIDRLGRARLPIFNYVHAGLADITSTIRALGARIGRAADANRLAGGMERDLDDIRHRVAGRPRPKTAVIFGREIGALRAIFASGGKGFLHDMLDTAGGTDTFADILQENVQASVEMLLTRAPEVILEVRPTEDWTPDRIARERAVWRGLPSLPAVRTDRVYMLTDDRLLTPGPRIVDGVRLMAKALHPDVMK